MRLTLRTENDNYIDVDIDISERTITFLSPIPNLTEEELFNLADDFHVTVILPISGEQVVPETSSISPEDIENKYTLSTYEVLTLLLSLINCAVTGD